MVIPWTEWFIPAVRDTSKNTMVLHCKWILASHVGVKGLVAKLNCCGWCHWWWRLTNMLMWFTVFMSLGLLREDIGTPIPHQYCRLHFAIATSSSTSPFSSSAPLPLPPLFHYTTQSNDLSHFFLHLPLSLYRCAAAFPPACWRLAYWGLEELQHINRCRVKTQAKCYINTYVSYRLKRKCMLIMSDSGQPVY